MSQYINYAESAILNHPQFITSLRQGLLALYDSVEKIHVKNEQREVKIIALEDKLYLLEKTQDSIGLYEKEIHDFETDRSLKSLLKYVPFDRDEMYVSTVVSLPLQESKKITNQEYLELLKGSDQYDRVKELVDILEKDGKNNYEYMLFNSMNKQTNDLKVSAMPDALRGVVDYLVEHQFLDEGKNDDFYRSLMSRGNTFQDKKIPDYHDKIEYFVKVCVEQDFSGDNPFVYNDLDNRIYLHNKSLIVTDQTCGFYFDIKDKENISVYFLDKEYKDTQEEILRIEEGLKNSTLDTLKDTVWEIKDGKTQFFNTVFMYVLDLNFEFGVKAMEEEGLGCVEYPVDITTYQYQRDYYYTKYGMNEFEFLAQAFLTLGGGFDYDQKAGTFVDKSIKYTSELEQEEKSTEPATDMNYCYPKKFNHLDQDWHNGLKYLVEVLERDRPTPVAYQGDSVDEALDKAISYLHLKLDKLEPKKKNKP